MSSASSAPPGGGGAAWLAAALAAGAAAALLTVPLAGVGRRFFVLVTLLGTVGLAIALVLEGLSIDLLHVASAGAMILANVLVPRQTARSGGGRELWFRLALLMAAATGLPAAARGFLAAGAPAAGERLGPWLAGPAGAAGALLVGSALVALALGHWYLVSPNLSFAPLRRQVRIVGVALIARFALAVVGVGGQLGLWSLRIEQEGGALLYGDGIFVLARVVFGYLAPAGLLVLVGGCLAERSSQSATGILYVVFVFVVIGELSALELSSGPGLAS